MPKKGRIRPDPTPSPLRKLEDPTEWHVMPSRKRSRPDGVAQTRKRRRKVLEEDLYEQKLSGIIQRDYYPDLPQLEAQLQWMEAVESKDPSRIATVQRNVLSQMRKMGNTPLVSAPEPTEQVAEKEKTTASATIDQFQQTYTTEDESNFRELLERDRLKHREKFWYHYSDKLANGSAVPQLKDLSEEERKLLTNRDDRPAGPGTWRWRPQNLLMGEPDLQTARESCGLPGEEVPGEKRLLTNGKVPETRIKRYMGSSRPSLPTSIDPKGTRFTGEEVVQHMLKAKGFTAKQADSRDIPEHAIKRSSREEDLDPLRGYSFVPTTPLLVPGVDAVPQMTWGTVEATPLMLGALSTPIGEKFLAGASSSQFAVPNSTPGPQFRLNGRSAREKTALKLEKRRTRGSKKKPQAPATRKDGSVRLMTPAARRLARRASRTPVLKKDT